MRRALLILVLCLLPAIALAQEADAPAEPDTTIGVGEDSLPDDAIEERLEGILAEMPQYEQVTVAVSSGVVRLTGEVSDVSALDALDGVAGRVDGVVAVTNDVAVTADLSRQLTPALERVRERVMSALVAAPLILVALTVFLLVAALGWFLTRWGFFDRIAPNRFIAEIYRTGVRVLFGLLGLVLALDVVNATALLGAVLGAAGVVGLALGFAVRDTVENFIASIMLSLRQPFRPNDFVEIDGDVGHVARLTSRATILISPEGNHVRIPNATVFKGKIVNYTRAAERRFEFELGVDAESDLGGALSTAVAALEALDFVLNDPPVAAWVKDVGDSNVVLTFTGWVDQTQFDFLKARGEAVRVSKTALEEAGFGLPEPIYRLRVDGALPVAEGTRSTDGPTRVTVQESDLPEASRPDRKEVAQEEAAERERQAEGASGDLLNPRQDAE